MGKKGKKSKRQKGSKVDANEVLLGNISNNIQKMEALVCDYIRNRQYSEASSKEKDAIAYVLTQGSVMTKASMAAKTVERYRSLLFIEYVLRKNYDQVIEIFNEFTSKYAHIVTLGAHILEKENIHFPMELKMMQVHYELALIRTTRNLCNIPILKSFIYREMNAEHPQKAAILKIHLVEALRVSKEYDHAIDLERKLLCRPNLVEIEPFETAASLFITYLERYRVEKHQSLQSASKAKNYSLINKVFDLIPLEYERTCNDDNLKQDIFLALAQWFYLCHTLGDEQHALDYVRKAINRVEFMARAKWKFRDHCFTCRQKSSTPSKLQLVCRDCRTSCYCDIDHQRASWIKDEVQGTRLGHKVFCPVLKAFRIWMEAEENGDEEREAKMERRFKKECIAFLAYGLGLEDKCFEVEDFAS